MVSKFQKSFEYTPGERAGESLERELLGVIRNVGTIEKERKRVEEIMKNKDISKIEAAVENIKEKQVLKEALNPSSPFANFVRRNLIDEQMELKDKEEEKVRYYSAVSDSKNKTVLDRDFGIDFFIELERDKEEPVQVTVDITLKPYKQNPKADIVFSLPDDFPSHARFEKSQLAGLSKPEEKTFIKYTEDLANQISEKIIKNLQKQSETL